MCFKIDTVRNVARCWAYETSLAVDQQLNLGIFKNFK
jgi:hypothetical protein